MKGAGAALRRHLGAMTAAAAKAGALLMRRYGQLQKRHIRMKSLNDFVTVVDKQSQDLIIRTLAAAFPAYGVRAEEGGVWNEREMMWVIDPLDGTSNYIHRFPQFCISIALMRAGESLVGLIHDPLHRETFTAAKGKGAFLNGRRIAVSGIRAFRTAFVATGFPYRMHGHFEPYHRSLRKVFYRTAGIRRGGSAALDLCYTACGRFDGFWEFGLSLWDIAAGSLIVEEAGGQVTDFEGRKRHFENGNVAAGSPVAQRALVGILKRIPEFREASRPRR